VILSVVATSRAKNPKEPLGLSVIATPGGPQSTESLAGKIFTVRDIGATRVTFQETTLKEIQAQVEEVSPVNGGCWFCRRKHGELAYSTEFDTYLHIACLQNALLRAGNDRETKIMAAELLDSLED
jgi:hypothetical protein